MEESKTEIQMIEMKNQNKIQQLEKQIKQLEDERLNILANDEQQTLDEHIMGRMSDLGELEDFGRGSGLPRFTQKQTQMLELKQSNL